MGNKKRKNKKKKKNNKKKHITVNESKKSLNLDDIFIVDEIFLKESKKIIDIRIEDIVNEIEKSYFDRKIILNEDYEKPDNLSFNLKDNIVDQNIYKEILEELDNYKEKNSKLTKSYLNIPLNDWGEWLYI